MLMKENVNWVSKRTSLWESDVWAKAWVIRGSQADEGRKNNPDGEKTSANTLTQKELGVFEE